MIPAEDIAIPDGPAGRRRRLVVLLICSSSLFLTYLDSTILNVALPTLQKDLHASIAGLQWVSDAYLLVVASLLMLTGHRRPARQEAAVPHRPDRVQPGLAAVLPRAEHRLAHRAAHAPGPRRVDAHPISLSIVRNTFHDPKERAQALGIWSAIFGVASACGPVVGGILVSSVGWRSIFWVNVPIGAAMIAAAIRYVPESRAPHPRRVDLPGQLLMIAFLASLTYAVIQGPVSGWTAAPILTLLAVAARARCVRGRRTRRQSRCSSCGSSARTRSPASVIAVLAFVVLGGFLFVITLYLQQVRGDSPLRAGLSLLPATIVMAAAAPVAGQLTGRRGPRIPLVASGLCIAAGMALLLGLGPGTSFTQVAVALAVIGAGLGLVNPPITNAGVSAMPPAQAGVASAVISATRQFGSVLGVAVMGDLVTTGVSSGMARGQSHAVALSGATHGAWALALGCGLAIALTGYLTTTARAHASAAAIAAAPAASPRPPPSGDSRPPGARSVPLGPSCAAL